MDLWDYQMQERDKRLTGSKNRQQVCIFDNREQVFPLNFPLSFRLYDTLVSTTTILHLRHGYYVNQIICLFLS
jgi:hypothetical protein